MTLRTKKTIKGISEETEVLLAFEIVVILAMAADTFGKTRIGTFNGGTL